MASQSDFCQHAPAAQSDGSVVTRTSQSDPCQHSPDVHSVESNAMKLSRPDICKSSPALHSDKSGVVRTDQSDLCRGLSMSGTSVLTRTSLSDLNNLNMLQANKRDCQGKKPARSRLRNIRISDMRRSAIQSEKPDSGSAISPLTGPRSVRPAPMNPPVNQPAKLVSGSATLAGAGLRSARPAPRNPAGVRFEKPSSGSVVPAGTSARNIRPDHTSPHVLRCKSSTASTDPLPFKPQNTSFAGLNRTGPTSSDATMPDERARWETSDVRALLDVLAEMQIERQLNMPGTRKGAVFAQVEERLRKKLPDVDRSARQIQEKYRQLKNKFCKVRSLNEGSGNQKTKMDFYEDLQRLIDSQSATPPPCGPEEDTSVGSASPSEPCQDLRAPRSDESGTIPANQSDDRQDTAEISQSDLSRDPSAQQSDETGLAVDSDSDPSRGTQSQCEGSVAPAGTGQRDAPPSVSQQQQESLSGDTPSVSARNQPATGRMPGGRSRWETSDVRALLDVLAEMQIERQLVKGPTWRGSVFARVEKRLRKKLPDVNKSAVQIQQKYRILKKKFNEVRSINQRRGSGSWRAGMEFYEDIQRLVDPQPATSPPCVPETDTSVGSANAHLDSPLPNDMPVERVDFDSQRAEIPSKRPPPRDSPEQPQKRPAATTEGSETLAAGRPKTRTARRYVSFRHARDLRDHMHEKHGIATATEVVMDQFSSMAEFEAWMEACGQGQGVQYVKIGEQGSDGHPDGQATHRYWCFQPGCSMLFYCAERECLPDNRPLEQTARCPSEIVATLQGDDSVTVVVHPFHYGHAIDEAIPDAPTHEAGEEGLGGASTELDFDFDLNMDCAEQPDQAAQEAVMEETLRNEEIDGMEDLVDDGAVAFEIEEGEEAGREDSEAEPASQSDGTVQRGAAVILAEEDIKEEHSADSTSETDSAPELTTMNSQEMPPGMVQPHDLPGVAELSADQTSQLTQAVVSGLDVVRERVRSDWLPQDVLLRVHAQVEQLKATLDRIPSPQSANARQAANVPRKRTPKELHELYCFVNDHGYSRFHEDDSYVSLPGTIRAAHGLLD